MITHQMIQTALDELHALTRTRGAGPYDTLHLDFIPNARPRIYAAFMPQGMSFHSGDDALEAIRIARQAIMDLPSPADLQRMALRRKLAAILDELRASDVGANILADFENPLIAAMNALSTNALPFHAIPDFDEEQAA
jgi:hypothetical protein